MHFHDIVKSYDVRAIHPDQITDAHVEVLGRAFAHYLNARTIAVGRDCRTSSPAFHRAVVNGITAHGVNVVDLGEVSTPMVYHAAGTLDVDGAVMITASHNPPKYNGMKFVRPGAVLIGRDSGLADIQRIAEEFVVKAPAPAAQPGTIKAGAVHSSYSSFVTKHADPGTRPLRAVIDPANMMGVLDIAILQALGPALEIEAIYDTLDGTMPNHEANPLNKESLHDLQQSVIERRADLGIAYDGDADRVGFVDEQGRTIQPHLITALLARYFLSVHPGSPIAYDVPSSRSVRIEIETNGGIPLQTKVGTANIKTAMREHEAVFGGEFSGHYYFKDHFYSEAPSLIAVLVMNLMVRENAPLSELIASVQHYYHSGEMNFALEPDTDKNALLARFKSTYPDGELTEIDGVRVDYDDWWFLVRPSNTEPLMRMSVEAATPELLEKKKRELSHVIDKYV